MAELARLDPVPVPELLERRYARLRRYGAFATA
jgi:acetyl-CoA carboxylase alpha subunit